MKKIFNYFLLNEEGNEIRKWFVPLRVKNVFLLGFFYCTFPCSFLWSNETRKQVTNSEIRIWVISSVFFIVVKDETNWIWLKQIYTNNFRLRNWKAFFQFTSQHFSLNVWFITSFLFFPSDLSLLLLNMQKKSNFVTVFSPYTKALHFEREFQSCSSLSHLKTGSSMCFNTCY